MSVRALSFFAPKQMLLPTAYLGPIPYYRLMHRATEVRIEACEHYPKQTLRNRCLIEIGRAHV